MSLGLVGRKVGMTRIFAEDGSTIPVTVLDVSNNRVTQIKTPDTDGYAAVQLGFGTNKENRFSRPVLGQFKKRNLPPARHVKEFRVTDAAPYQVGASLTVALFEQGEHVDVQGVTKGRGFAGVVKRHKFVAGHASHGPTAGKQPGSIGASAYPSRVVKGKRLPGRMGGANLTIKNLVVVAVDPEQDLLMVRGAIPGPPNGLVFVKKRGV